MTKYLIDDEEVEESEFWQRLETEISDYVDRNIDDIIDDENEEIHIGSLTFNPSYVIKECDPVAYRCYISDVVDYQLSDARYDIECGRGAEVDGVEFTTEEVDEEQEEE